MSSRLTVLRVAIARAICPPGTVVVPPCVARRPIRADIAPTRQSASTDASNADLRAHLIRKSRDTAPIRILIVKCADSSMWYADKIGKYVPFEGKWPEGWISRDRGGHINIVKFEDGVVT